MADVTIKYKGQPIAAMDASGSKTLKTQGKYCEGDIDVEYDKPAAPTGTKQITITENGTTTEDVAAYADAEITVDVQGGTAITDGIVVTARDANGYATEIDYYGETLWIEQFSSRYVNEVGWRYLTTINFINDIKYVQPRFAAGRTSITTLNGLDFDKLLTIDSESFADLSNMPFGNIQILNATFPTEIAYLFSNCSGLTGITMHSNSSRIGDGCFRNCTSLTYAIITGSPTMYGRNKGDNYSIFYNCTSLQMVLLGNVGTTITLVTDNTFAGCTQNELTITVYSNATYVDTLLQNIRNSATNATIIIKASEATEYNGTPYSAGDTILTSEVES